VMFALIYYEKNFSARLTSFGALLMQ
jgi:hypothetical protein